MSYYYDDTPFFFRQPTQHGMQQTHVPTMQPYMGGMQSPMGGMPTLPTGVPAGPLVGPVPGAPAFPAPAPSETEGPPLLTVESTQFVPGYLRSQIGKQVRVEFLIGSSGPLIDRIGTLIGVGASYILIRPIETDDILMCDLYSIRFVTTLA